VRRLSFRAPCDQRFAHHVERAATRQAVQELGDEADFVTTQIQHELNTAMIVVTHDLGVIRLLASRTLVMKHGRVIESGLTDQILEDPQHAYTQRLVASAL